MSRRRVAALGDLPVEEPVGVELDGVPLCLVKLSGGEVCALSDICTHEDVNLSEGAVYNGSVECPQHGSLFDLKTGAVTGLPAEDPVQVYPVTIEGEDVYVEL